MRTKNKNVSSVYHYFFLNFIILNYNYWVYFSVLEDEDSDEEMDEERYYKKVYDLLSTSSLS